MSLVTWYDQAALHRDVSIALLDAFLPHGGALKLAQAVGVTPQWIAYFRQADSFSMPSLELGRRIAKAIPAPAHYRRAFVDHLQAARQAYAAARQEVRLVVQRRLPVAAYLQELNAAFYAANFGPNPSATPGHYGRALALGRLIVTNVPPAAYPLEYLETCGTLLHIHIALDEIVDGLYWVKLGNHIAAQLPATELATPFQRERLRHLRYLLARDEALGYHHLGNDKAALRCYERAEAALRDHPNPRSQVGDLARNRLLALPGTPRFAIGEAEALAAAAWPVFEQKADHLGVALNQQALARALIAHGNRKSLKRAEGLLRDLPATLAQLPNAGAIHRAVTLTTLAELARQRGDQSERQRLLAQVLVLARQAGLVQIQQQARAGLHPSTGGVGLESVVEYNFG